MPPFGKGGGAPPFGKGGKKSGGKKSAKPFGKTGAMSKG